MIDLRTVDFDYALPPELIAQRPADRRDASRLMVVNRSDGSISHHTFGEIGHFLRRGDLLVANRSRVIPARLEARKDTGGTVGLLLLRPCSEDSWIVLARPSRRLHCGMKLKFPASDLEAQLDRELGEGRWAVRFSAPTDVSAAIREAGRIPLPPYIRSTDVPVERYQTVYADRDGSIAAPTAGLHFTPELLAALQVDGVEIEYVTLHVGLGTFRPVQVEYLADHQMHAEWGELPASVADTVNAVRAEGGRVVAVGTTSTRLLESAWQEGLMRPFCGETNRFIVPGYEFHGIDALITNFHLPRSTLLMLVSALAGRDLIRRAYEEAVAAKYRFFSFGDAMLII